MTFTNPSNPGSIIHGDCIPAMRKLPWASVDFILTDPPYLVNYRDRSGRSVANDIDGSWLKPAFAQMHRVLRPNSLAVSFYGFNRVDLFMDAWKSSGFVLDWEYAFRIPRDTAAIGLRWQREQSRGGSSPLIRTKYPQDSKSLRIALMALHSARSSDQTAKRWICETQPDSVKFSVILKFD